MTEEDILKREREQAASEPQVFEPPASLKPAAFDGPLGETPAAVPKPALTPEEEEVRAFWREYGRELVRGSVKNIDSLGRQVMLVDGLLVGLYTGVVVFGDLGTQPLTGVQIFLYLLPLIFLLFSLLFAGGVFFLEKIPLELRSARGARAIYTDAVKNKIVFLRTSMLLLALSVVSIIGAMWVYLS